MCSVGWSCSGRFESESILLGAFECDVGGSVPNVGEHAFGMVIWEDFEYFEHVLGLLSFCRRMEAKWVMEVVVEVVVKMFLGGLEVVSEVVVSVSWSSAVWRWMWEVVV